MTVGIKNLSEELKMRISNVNLHHVNDGEALAAISQAYKTLSLIGALSQDEKMEAMNILSKRIEAVKKTFEARQSSLLGLSLATETLIYLSAQEQSLVNQ